MMKYIPLIFLLLSGCASSPQEYDMSTSSILPPIITKQKIPNILISDFKYEPSISINQNTISNIGCLPCHSDGSTPGFVYAKPINEIVETEVKGAFKEVIIPSNTSQCKLSATIHLVAFNSMNGDSVVDLTYILSSSNKIKLIKRIRGEQGGGLLEINKIDRLLAKASRSSVEKLVTNTEFLNEIQKSCAQ